MRREKQGLKDERRTHNVEPAVAKAMAGGLPNVERRIGRGYWQREI